jgi:hypothetical protein
MCCGQKRKSVSTSKRAVTATVPAGAPPRPAPPKVVPQTYAR